MMHSANMATLACMTLLLAVETEGARGTVEEDERCAVFVSKLEEQDEATLKVAKEVNKELKEKKKWFRLVDGEDEADASVELTLFGRAKDLKAQTVRTESGTSGQSGNLQRPALLDLESGYFIEFRITVADQFRTTMTATGRGAGSAARSLARQLHTICDTYVE